MHQFKGIHHHTVLVSELNKSLYFYCNILGLQTDSTRPQLPFIGAWILVGEQSIHLMQIENPDQGVKRPEHGGRDRHVALSCSGLDYLISNLIKNEISFTQSNSGRQAIFFRDPDDNAIEVIEAS